MKGLLKNIKKEELQKIVSECLSKNDLALKLGLKYTNGQINKKLLELVNLHGISIDHFDSSAKNKARRKYEIVKKICPVCNQEFETEQGHAKEKATCSYSCANKFFADIKHTEMSNLKRSLKLKHNAFDYDFKKVSKKKKTFLIKRCDYCNIDFICVEKDAIYCSSACSAYQRIDNGTHKGWASRSNLLPSFPEKITLEILNELGLSLQRELKVNKWFIDFADVDRKIAIEIDGKQHELPERKASDSAKDTYLISQGWKVHRIKWNKLNKETRAELKETISKILL